MFYQLKMLYKCEIILYYSSPKNICIILGDWKANI